MKSNRKNIKKPKEEVLMKNIKQYSYGITSSDYNEFKEISQKYNRVKNYVYSRFSGINSISLIDNSDKNIRDIWTANNFIDEWNIPRRFVRNAIEDASSNIKSMWTNTLNIVKLNIAKNKKLNDEEKHFIFYIMKSKNLLFEVLVNKHISVISEKFNTIKDTKKLFILIRREVRMNKPRISKAKSFNMQLDDSMYSYKGDEILLSTRKKGKRISLKVNTQDRFKGNIRIKIEKDKFTISKAIKTKTKPNNFIEHESGIDKNFINAIHTSDDTVYGVGLNLQQKSYTDFVNESHKKRQPYYDKIKELKKNPTPKNLKKIQNIQNNNLGKEKYNRKINKYKEEIRKNICGGINQYIKIDKPTTTICEDLSKQMKSNKKYNKKVKNQLSSWMKGLIQEKLEYKTKQNQINLALINPAYTSQECPICREQGFREQDVFYCHNHCFGENKGVASGLVGASNAVSRFHDEEITLKTPPSEVKSILNKRLIDKNVDSSKKIHFFGGEKTNKPNQPRPSKISKKKS